MGTSPTLLKRLQQEEERRFGSGKQHRTFVGTYIQSPDPEIVMRAEAEMSELDEKLGYRDDMDVAILTAVYCRPGEYKAPTLALADWHANYDLIFGKAG
jgi:hypothetical protein